MTNIVWAKKKYAFFCASSKKTQFGMALKQTYSSMAQTVRNILV